MGSHYPSSSHPGATCIWQLDQEGSAGTRLGVRESLILRCVAGPKAVLDVLALTHPPVKVSTLFCLQPCFGRMGE
ncbi:hypothetical protein J1605_003871 [Eschrichtius robustus]|uniref:Uncharacterized protein n=1 Tax=Eschrichtius robustus TaxID=9764 RepID=A0AB34HN43_ESCRO|nr:hypothetical protein J1605_003871 [Eschrichtius robustus]